MEPNAGPGVEITQLGQGQPMPAIHTFGRPTHRSLVILGVVLALLGRSARLAAMDRSASLPTSCPPTPTNDREA